MTGKHLTVRELAPVLLLVLASCQHEPGASGPFAAAPPIALPPSRPIETPIVLRLAPTPRYAIASKSILKFDLGKEGEKIEVTQEFQAHASMSERGDRLFWDMTLSKYSVEANAGGKNQSFALADEGKPIARIHAVLDSKGKIDEFRIDPDSFQSLSTKSTPVGKSDIEKVNAELGRMLKIVPGWPSKGVRDGDVLYSIDLRELAGGAGIGSIGGTIVGHVAGLTDYEGHPHVIGRLSFVVSVAGVTLPFSGYELIDVATGLRSFSTMRLDGTVEDRGKRARILYDETMTAKIERQPTPALGRPPAPIPEKGPSLEDRLDAVRRLLERGLITEEEAREKRRKILEAL